MITRRPGFRYTKSVEKGKNDPEDLEGWKWVGSIMSGPTACLGKNHYVPLEHCVEIWFGSFEEGRLIYLCAESSPEPQIMQLVACHYTEVLTFSGVR